MSSNKRPESKDPSPEESKNQPNAGGLRWIEQGVIVTLVLAAITFAFWLGGISNTQLTLEKDVSQLKSKQDALDKVLPLPMDELNNLARLVEDLKAVKNQQDDWLKQLPVGTILPLYIKGDDKTLYELLPRNWVLCDGTTINEGHPRKFEKDEVDATFWNLSVPDLKGRFLRGAITASDCGLAAGEDVVKGLKTSNAGSHVHSLPPLTGGISNEGPDPGGEPYRVRDDDRKWVDGNHLTTEGKTGRYEGQHLHLLGGDTGSSGIHNHGIPDVPTVPKHISVRYAIRIK